RGLAQQPSCVPALGLSRPALVADRRFGISDQGSRAPSSGARRLPRGAGQIRAVRTCRRLGRTTVTMPGAPARSTDQSVQVTLSLLQDVLGSAPTRDVAVRLWDGTTWKPQPAEPTRCTLVLRHPGALRRMFMPPNELRLGEAYIYDDFDIEGEIEAVVPLIRHFLDDRRT